MELKLTELEKYGIIALIAVVIILAAFAFFINVAMNQRVSDQQKITDLQNQVDALKVQPTMTPAVTNDVITFTVLSCTVSNGQYQVLTTDGRSVIFQDYASWNAIIPQGIYIADSTLVNGQYLVKSANLLSYSNYHRPYVVGREENYYYHRDYKYQEPKRQSLTPQGNPCLFAYCG